MEKTAKKVARKLNDWQVSYTNETIYANKTIEGTQVKMTKSNVWIDGIEVATSKGITHETKYKKKLSVLMQNEIEYALVHIGKIEKYL